MMKKRYLIIVFLVLFLGFKKDISAYSFKSVEGNYTGSDVLFCGPYYNLEEPVKNGQNHPMAVFLKFAYSSKTYYVYALDMVDSNVSNDGDGTKQLKDSSGAYYNIPFCKSNCPLYISVDDSSYNKDNIVSNEFKLLEKKSDSDKHVFTFLTDDLMLKCKYDDNLSLYYYNRDGVALIIPDYVGGNNYTVDTDLANKWAEKGITTSDTEWINKYGFAYKEKRCPSLENMATLDDDNFKYDKDSLMERSDLGIDYCQNEPTSICFFYNEYVDEIKKHYKAARDCDKTKDEYCDVPYILKADEYVSSITESCSHLYSVIDSDTACAKKCLGFGEELKQLKKDYGIKSTEGACSLSSRIIKFIANILKWVKYIAPVLVIVLGILDFIKAISAQSEDEMKKAQGKFVKRLIAAALLFLLPFIIQFILERFNMANDNPYCNLL